MASQCDYNAWDFRRGGARRGETSRDAGRGVPTVLRHVLVVRYDHCVCEPSYSKMISNAIGRQGGCGPPLVTHAVTAAHATLSRGRFRSGGTRRPGNRRTRS